MSAKWFAAAAAAIWLMAAGLAFAENGSERYFARPNEAYCHNDPNCSFGVWETGDEYTELLTYASRGEAEAAGARLCPSCAADWKPMFTGSFPAWTLEIRPWVIGSPDTWLPAEVREAWGNVPERIYELWPQTFGGEGDRAPDDYAGVFLNACGGYTVLMTNPTAERAADYRDTLDCDFWVMEARYSLNELLEAQSWITEKLMGGEENWFGIVSCGVMEDMNRVEIGTTDASPENRAAILRTLCENGFTGRNFFRITECGLPNWEF